MNPIFAAALEVQEFCRARVFRFCFIGGLALQRWGEPRLTQDVDLTVISGFGRETEYADQFLSAFAPRIPDARAFALRHRVLLLLGSNGTPLDIALGAMPFEDRAVSRSVPFAVAEGVSLQICGAEDLIVFKAFAGRAQDWLDIEGVATAAEDGGQRLIAYLVARPSTAASPQPQDELIGDCPGYDGEGLVFRTTAGWLHFRI